MEVVIRRATIEDYDALCSLWAEVDNLHADALSRFFRRIPGPARSLDHVAQLLADEDSAIWVAELQNELVGLLTAEIRTAPAYAIFVQRSWVLIEDLVVRSAHRRRGIGRALMETAHDWAVQRGASDVQLTVWEFNDEARAFYEALGYRTVSRSMSYTLK